VQSCGEEVEEEEGASFILAEGLRSFFCGKLLDKVGCLPCACRHSHCLFQLKYATLQQIDRCEGQLKMVCTYVSLFRAVDLEAKFEGRVLCNHV
jgi:hypothetical protein